MSQRYSVKCSKEAAKKFLSEVKNTRTDLKEEVKSWRR